MRTCKERGYLDAVLEGLILQIGEMLRIKREEIPDIGPVLIVIRLCKGFPILF